MQRALDLPMRLTLLPDKVGVLIACILAYAVSALPFVTFRANRIVQGEARDLITSLPTGAAYTLIAVVIIAALAAFFRVGIKLKLTASLLALFTLMIVIGLAANFLTPEGNSYARVSPASGFWFMFAGLALLVTDTIARLDPKPYVRVLLLLAALAILSGIFLSNQWNGLSVMKEYGTRADIFWTEAVRHLQLAIGSLFAASIIGIPLGVLCHRVSKLRVGLLNSLNIVQTIPSIALFGLLIAPLGWVTANIPGASDIGIRGIGMAPAFVALFLYSLLPVVSNTVVGLEGVPNAVTDAARGLGMRSWQRLLKIEFPLALPIILTGIRIVLVQNIGLATIAALIGGGGFGVFVFQGIGQTAMDLVLLGTIPTVVLGFTAAILLDALIESNLFKRGSRS